MSEPVGYGLFVDGKCLAIGQHPSSGHVGGKAYKSQPLYTRPQEDCILGDEVFPTSTELIKRPKQVAEDYFADACRLALELECLLLDCKDTAVTAKWWESAIEALDQHRDLIEKMRTEQV